MAPARPLADLQAVRRDLDRQWEGRGLFRLRGLRRGGGLRGGLLDLLREYMEPGDRSILISSHISADLEVFCDDLYMIDEGKIIFHEDTDVLLSDYALLKMTEEQYGALDKSYILRYKKETFGYSCLTNQKQFYMENHPEVTVEKGTIDELILMMICGKVYG